MRRLGWVLLAITLLGCKPGVTVPAPSGQTDALVVVGGSGGTTTASPTPTPSPSPHPTPSPTPTPVPEDPNSYVPFAIGVTPTIDATTINLPPPEGELALYPYTTRVSADVLMSNGFHSTQVSWSSSNPDLASVDGQGNVTARGLVPGTVEIIATSLDNKASGSVSLTVTGYTDLGVVVE